MPGGDSHPGPKTTHCLRSAFKRLHFRALNVHFDPYKERVNQGSLVAESAEASSSELVDDGFAMLVEQLFDDKAPLIATALGGGHGPIDFPVQRDDLDST